MILKKGYGVVYLHDIILLSILSGRLWAEHMNNAGKAEKRVLN